MAGHISEGIPSLALVGGGSKLRSELIKRLAEQYGIQVYPEREPQDDFPVIGNVPAGPRPCHSGLPPAIPRSINMPWVAAFLPELPDLSSSQTQMPNVPRLVARIQRTTEATQWPAPHQMWPAGWTWPEYRLEVDDIAWAVSELASALASMRCPVTPISDDGSWF